MRIRAHKGKTLQNRFSSHPRQTYNGELNDFAKFKVHSEADNKRKEKRQSS